MDLCAVAGSVPTDKPERHLNVSYRARPGDLDREQ